MLASPNIGNILKEYVKQKRIYQSGWARQAGLNPQTIAQYLKQPSMRVDTLFTICQHLNHNFLREIADLLPENIPPVATTNQTVLVEQLQNENQQLKVQIATLEKALSLIGRRG